MQIFAGKRVYWNMEDTHMKLIYMGTPDIAVPALNALHEGGHEILAVDPACPR